MVLDLMGHETQVAFDGPGALDAAERFRPHLIFMDIGLPKLDGYDTCRRLRTLPWGRGTVIVALTGRGHPEDRLRSEEAGFSHHVLKPMGTEELERVLADLPTDRPTAYPPPPL